MSRKLLVSLTCLFLFVGAWKGVALAATPEERYVVSFRPGTTEATQSFQLNIVGGSPLRSIDSDRLAFRASPAAAEALSRKPEVLEVHSDARVRADFTPNDPCFKGCSEGDQWGFERVSAPGAWDMVPGGSADAPIAVLDTGVDGSHPDLGGRVLLEVNLSDSPGTGDVNGHGTFVAGVVAATGNNGAGMAGLNWASSIMSYKVLDDNGNGWVSDIAAAIILAADAGAKVINLSLSGASGSIELQSAVQYASLTSVVVSSAGNNASNAPTYPSAYQEVLAVAATGRDDTRAPFSNYGDWVDLAAPGVEILSTRPGGLYGLGSGTSFAAPIVAGTAALVWKSSFGTDAAAVRHSLSSTADALPGSGLGQGLVNAARAVGLPPPATQAAQPQPQKWSPWTTLGGVLTSAPDATSDSAGNLSVFARGADDGLWTRRSVSTGWTAWSSLGGILSSDPAAVSAGPETLDVFVRGADSALWQNRWDRSRWSGWMSLGGILSSDPSASSSDPGKISVFAKGGDNALWKRDWDGSIWSAWTSLGGILSSSPDASSRGNGTVDVFARGGDAALWMRSFDGSSWTGWSSLGGRLSSDPASVSWSADHIDVFVRGGDGALWQKSWNGGWGSWGSLGGALNSNPAAASRGTQKIDVLAAGRDNALWIRSFGSQVSHA